MADVYSTRPKPLTREWSRYVKTRFHEYASILMGISNTFATLPGIISPGLTSLIVEDKSNPSQWQIVFFLAAGIYLVGAVIYGIFASGSRQKWAEVPTGYIPHRTEVEHVH